VKHCIDSFEKADTLKRLSIVLGESVTLISVHRVEVVGELIVAFVVRIEFQYFADGGSCSLWLVSMICPATSLSLPLQRA